MKVIRRGLPSSSVSIWYAPMCCVMPLGLALADLRLPDRVEQPGLTVVDVTHDGHDRRPDLQILFATRVVAVGDVEGLQQLAVLLLGADDLNVVVHFAAEQLEDVVRHGLRRGDHLAEVEEHLHQRSRVGVDLLGEVGQRSATRQPDRLALPLGQADAADAGRLHVVHVLLALLPLRLATLARGTTRTPEGTRRAATATGATTAAATAETAAATGRGTGTGAAATGTETTAATAAATGTEAATGTAAATGAAAETAAAATGTATSAAAGAATGTATGTTASAATGTGRALRAARHHAGVRPRGHVARARPVATGAATGTRSRTVTAATGPTGTRRAGVAALAAATGTRTLRARRGAGTDTERVVADPRGARTGLGTAGLGALRLRRDDRTGVALRSGRGRGLLLGGAAYASAFAAGTCSTGAGVAGC